MKTLLDAFAAPATRAPKITIAVLAVVTVLLGVAAGGLQVSTEFDAFAPADGAAAAVDDIDDRFGAGESFQILVDAGPGGDLLTPEGLAAGEQLADTLTDDPDVSRWLAPDGADRPAVVTYALPFEQAGDALEVPLEDLDQTTLDTVVDTLLDDEDVGPQVEALLSQDLSRDPARARAGLAVVELAGGLDNGEVAQASHDVSAALRDVDAPDLRLSLFSEEVIEQAVEDSLARDVPLLLALSLLLVVGTLAVLFRTVSDVVVGLTGLVASIVWMAGLAALLGPTGLGLVGPFNQVAIAVPVLLVGLGVDYSVHLTTRYREQQARGDAPVEAARTSLRTVGVALVLATAATIGGFLSNLATPLQPIADFGVFASVGILAAFVVLGLLVPAVRVLLDQRRSSGAPSSSSLVGGPAAATSATGAVPATAATAAAPGPEPLPQAAGRSRLTAAGTAVATRAPKAVVGVTAALCLVAGIGASNLGTEFQERDFLPEGSAALQTIDRLTELFDGRVGEQTFVLIEGDADDPQLLAAVADYERGIADLDGVRTVGDRADVVSPFEVVDRLGDVGVRVRDAVEEDLRGWDDPDAVAAELELPDRLDPELVAQQAEDGTADVDVPDEVRDALERRLPGGRDPQVALATTAPDDEIREGIVAERRDELIETRPASLSDGALQDLLDRGTEGLRLATLDDAGYPLDRLSEDDRDALSTLDELEDAGWSADGTTRDGEQLREQVAVVSDRDPEELATTRDADGLLLTVGTSAGQSNSAQLQADLEAAGDAVRDAGGELSVASNALVEAEIISSLSDAQLVAILISVLVAGLLLVVASWVSDRSIALGAIGIVPAAVALVLVLGSMRLLGMSFNALTATVASIAVGIGVPYGIHLTNRFRASIRTFGGDPTEAIADTLQHTGGALAGSAVTTGLAFGVLMLSSSTPLQQFGGVSAMMIGYALIACLLLQPALLVLWARRRSSRAPA